MSLTVIILAAGKGTRMRSKLPKVLQPLAGKPLLWHVIAAAKAIDAGKIISIYGYKGDEVQAHFTGESVTWVEQAEQLGTGHAVQMALSDVPRTGQSIILYGDVPLIQPKTLKRLVETNTSDDNRNLSMITLNVENPFGLGRIVRDDNERVCAIVEEKDANEYQKHIKEVNTGIYCIDNMLLHELLPNLTNNNAQQEYYLTDIVKMAAESGSTINTIAPKLAFETDGVNNKVQLAQLERKWQSHLAGELMAQGVTMTDPEHVEIRGTIRCGQDVSIDTGVIFTGDCVLGDDVCIDAGCIISSSHIEDGAHIKPYCVIDESHVGKNASIGPFAHLRPNTQLGDDTKIGNFVETKKSRIAAGSKVNHLSYVGDADIGKAVNVGAGTITCNYDGANKHKTTIGDGAFIGSNSSLVAPVTVGSGATVGAGSTITKDVADNALAVARGKQVQKDNYIRPQK